MTKEIIEMFIAMWIGFGIAIVVTNWRIQDKFNEIVDMILESEEEDEQS